MLMCREHQGAAAIVNGPPAALKPEDVEVKEEKTMGRKPADIDWAKVQDERNAGASVEALRKKYNTSWINVKNNTAAPASEPPRGGRLTRIADAATSRQPRKVQTPAKRTGGKYDAVIAELIAKLTAKRDKLNEVIGVLHELNA
jgi:hypothetical protein